MNRRRVLAGCLLGVATVVYPQWSISWYTVDGSGGTSSGGSFILHGTAGQPDAGEPATGGAFELSGGFWVMPIVLQSPEAPWLRLEMLAPGVAQLSWDAGAEGFVLQEATDLRLPDPWTNAVSGSTNPVSVPMSSTRRYFRLHTP